MNLTPYQQKVVKWLIVVVIIAALAISGVKYPEQDDIPPFPIESLALDPDTQAPSFTCTDEAGDSWLITFNPLQE